MITSRASLRGKFMMSRPALRPTQPPVQWLPGLSRGILRPGRDGKGETYLDKIFHKSLS